MLAEPITQLIYRYQDAAVPPPYHRSIDIRIDAEKITLVVDSYGSILAKTEQDSPSDIMLKNIRLDSRMRDFSEKQGRCFG